MSHPSLGLPPNDRTGGLPPSAAKVETSRPRLAARALEIAIDRDPTLRDRYDELGLRRLLRDVDVFIERIVDSIRGDDPEPARWFADSVPPAYRRRKVPMDDLVSLAEGIRGAIGGILPVAEMRPVDEAVDAMIERFLWHRRIAGDARKRNRLLQAIYKGA